MDCGDHRNGFSNPHWRSDGSSAVNCLGGGYKLGVKALNIIWGNDPRFWQFTKLPEKETRSIGFKEGAALLQVNWIEVTGRIPITSTFKNIKYEIFYVVKFRADAFGWHSVPLKFKVKLNGEEKVKSEKVELLVREKNEIWNEINGGQFTISVEKGGVLEFGMYEVDSDWWKGGTVLAGINIIPSYT